MRLRRIIVVLTALLALGFSSAIATPRASVFAATAVCACVVTARETAQSPVPPASHDTPFLCPSPEPLKLGAWAAFSIPYQLPPPTLS
jgi:hypothetical protein